MSEERASYRAEIDLTEATRLPLDQVVELVAQLEKRMKEFAKALNFEKAAEIRDEIMELKRFIPSHVMGGDASGEKKPYKKARRAR